MLPQLVRLTKDWIDGYVLPYLKDGAFPQMLLFVEYSHAAAERIHRAIALLTDDTADRVVALLTRGRITSDGVGPHTDLLDEFPYLGPPHLASSS